MESSSRGNQRKLILICVAAVLIVGLEFTGLWIMAKPHVEPLLEQAITPKTCTQELDSGVALWDKDRQKAERLIKHALANSRDESIQMQINMRRTYADKLWASGNWQEGDWQIEQAIQLSKDKEPTNSGEALALSNAYHERGEQAYVRFLQDRSRPDGIADVEKAISIFEKTYTWQETETANRAAFLALMYYDTNQKAKAEKLMKRCLQVCAQNSDEPHLWYTLAMQSEIQAMAGNYRSAVDAFEQATSRTRSTRAWNSITREFTDGLERNSKALCSEMEIVHPLFEDRNYKAIDELARKALADGSSQWEGSWSLDCLHNEIAARGAKSSEGEFQAHLQRLRQWLGENPQSPVARIALAETLINYAWNARGTGTEAIPFEDEKLFQERLAEAKQVLDQDTQISEKSPRAFSAYAQIAIGERMPKEQYFQMLERCHKLWPTYLDVDHRTCLYLQPRWLGSDKNEWNKFATARADALGSTKGDVAYALLAGACDDYYNNIFKETTIDWKRVKRGYSQIFRAHPSDLNPRIAFVKLANQARDAASVRVAFAGL
jgi:hypothetical protein